MGIKYNTGATGLAGSLGGESEEILSQGFANVTSAKPGPFDYPVREDENGNTQEGNRWDFRTTGAAGRPRGEER